MPSVKFTQKALDWPEGEIKLPWTVGRQIAYMLRDSPHTPLSHWVEDPITDQPREFRTRAYLEAFLLDCADYLAEQRACIEAYKAEHPEIWGWH
jgi:hypothetical protein